MAREIKFRAWDTNNKEWASLVIGQVNGQQTVITGAHSNSALQDWQQYTNLKDKNGKEIYEGDVVRLSHSSEDYTGMSGSIEWCTTGCCGGYRIQFIGVGNNERFAKYTDGCEVIGNIYENPELIK